MMKPVKKNENNKKDNKMKDTDNKVEETEDNNIDKSPDEYRNQEGSRI
jgi:hypothetical protein